MDLIIISLKINLLSPWYGWKGAEMALNNNHSITLCEWGWATDYAYANYLIFTSSKHNLSINIWICNKNLSIMIGVSETWRQTYTLYNWNRIIKTYSDLQNKYNGTTVSAWQYIHLLKRRGFAPGFVNYKKGALDSHLQVTKFTSYLPMVGGFLRVLLRLPPLKLVAMISLKYCWNWR